MTKVFVFADFEFEPVTGRLTRSGATVALRPQPAALLALLLERRGSVVSKNEILESVWCDSFVQDQSVFQSITELRKSLGDSAREPAFIKTVARRGYRWICDETEEITRSHDQAESDQESEQAVLAEPPDRGHAAQPQPRRAVLSRWLSLQLGWRLAIIAGVLVLLGSTLHGVMRLQRGGVESTPQLAVLPFENATGDSDLDWIAYGLAERVSRSLAASPGIRTIGLDQIARAEMQVGRPAGEDAVNAWLSGLIRGHGADWIVQARLEDGGEQHRLVYTLYNGFEVAQQEVLEGKNPVALARILTENVAAVVDTSPTGARVSAADSSFLDEVYAKGIHQLYRGGAKRAQAYFQVCLDNDPSFLEAKMKLAICYEKLSDYDESERLTREVLRAAQVAGNRAIEGKAFNNLGTIGFRRGDWQGAEEAYWQALSATEAVGDSRGSAWALGNLGNVAMATGKYEEAEARLSSSLDIMRVLRDRVGEANALGNLGMAAFHRGRLDEARALYQQSLALREDLGDQQGVAWVLCAFGDLEDRVGDLDAAISCWRRSLALHHQVGDRLFKMRALLRLGEAQYRRRQLADARERYLDALTLARELEIADNEIGIQLALGMVELDAGKPEHAEEWFAAAIASSVETSRAELHDRAVIAVVNAYLEREMLEPARHYYHRASKEQRSLPELLVAGARLDHAVGDNAAAAMKLAQIKHESPEHWYRELDELLEEYRRAAAQ